MGNCLLVSKLFKSQKDNQKSTNIPMEICNIHQPANDCEVDFCISRLHFVLVSLLEDGLQLHSPLYDRLKTVLSRAEQQMCYHWLPFYRLRRRSVWDCLDEDWIEPCCEWIDTVDFWPPLPSILSRHHAVIRTAAKHSSVCHMPCVPVCSRNGSNGSSIYQESATLSVNLLSGINGGLYNTLENRVRITEQCCPYLTVNKFYFNTVKSSSVISGSDLINGSSFSTHCNNNGGRSNQESVSNCLQSSLFCNFNNISSASVSSACVGNARQCFSIQFSRFYCNNCSQFSCVRCKTLKICNDQNGAFFFNAPVQSACKISCNYASICCPYSFSVHNIPHTNWAYSIDETLASMTTDGLLKDTSMLQFSNKFFSKFNVRKSLYLCGAPCSSGSSLVTFNDVEFPVTALQSPSCISFPCLVRSNCLPKQQLLLDLLEPLTSLASVESIQTEMCRSITLPLLRALLSADDTRVQQLATKAAANLATSVVGVAGIVRAGLLPVLQRLSEHPDYGVQLSAVRACLNCHGNAAGSTNGVAGPTQAASALDGVKDHTLCTAQTGDDCVLKESFNKQGHEIQMVYPYNEVPDDSIGNVPFNIRSVVAVDTPVYLEGVYPVLPRRTLLNLFQRVSSLSPPALTHHLSIPSCSSLSSPLFSLPSAQPFSPSSSSSSCLEHLLPEAPSPDATNNTVTTTTSASLGEERCEDEDLCVDVVLLHGVNGNAAWTWRQCDEARVEDAYTWCWPADWLTEDVLSTCRVTLRLLAVNYPEPWQHCDTMSLSCQSRYLRRALLAAGVGAGGRPVLWMGHSRGGLLLKGVLAEDWLKQEDAVLCRQTAGVVFLSVPHVGAPLAALAAVLSPNTPALQGLAPGSRDLSRLQRVFTDVKDACGFSVLSLVDTEPHTLLGGWGRVMMVPSHSADPGIGEVAHCHVTHLDICKPKDRSSPVYTTILDFVQRVCKRVTEHKSDP